MLCLEGVTGDGCNQAESLTLKWRVALLRAISEPTWKCGLLQSESQLLLLAMVEARWPMHEDEIFFSLGFWNQIIGDFFCIFGETKVFFREIGALVYMDESGLWESLIYSIKVKTSDIFFSWIFWSRFINTTLVLNLTWHMKSRRGLKE